MITKINLQAAFFIERQLIAVNI